MALARAIPRTLGDALEAAREILSRRHELVRRGSIDAEAERIVEAAWRQAGLGKLTRMDFFTRLAEALPEAAGERVIVLASARSEGRILQHLIGYQAFLEHEYGVSAHVLVPRPETEVLVSAAIDHLAPLGPALGLEIGLGSGVISIELLARLPGLRMVASEPSEEAASQAYANASRILSEDGVSRLTRIKPGSIEQVLEPFAGGPLADFLISNPPYLTAEDGIDADVREHEPHLALFAPASDPLHFYRRIALEARRYLKSGAPVFLELPHERASVILDLFENGPWKDRKLLPDLNERDRVLVAWTK